MILWLYLPHGAATHAVPYVHTEGRPATVAKCDMSPLHWAEWRGIDPDEATRAKDLPRCIRCVGIVNAELLDKIARDARTAEQTAHA